MQPIPGRAMGSDRARTCAELQDGTHDLLVIGGGILGISVTWMAAQAGMRVAMLEAGDFASATSTASSKLVHGGLRYLQTGNLRLVAENHRERRALAGTIAPHLVRPLQFLVPVYDGGPHRAAKLGAGVFLYSALSAFGDGPGRVISPGAALRRVPALRAAGLRSAAVYGDHQMNDARMAIMTVRAAADAGASVLNHAPVTQLVTTRGRVTEAGVRDALTGAEFGVRARQILNATGPWVDYLRRMEDPAAASSIRLSKGAHLVMRQREPWQAALTIPVDRYRVSFAVPWEDHLLLGTTDEPYEGDPADVRATTADAEQILAEASLAIDDGYLDPDEVTYAYAGLRVLPLGSDGNTSAAKRETVITSGRGGMLSVAGGKWTTYRHIGRQVLDRIAADGRGMRGDVSGGSQPVLPLPGLADPVAVARQLRAGPGRAGVVADDVAAHLATHYGTLAFEIARIIRDDPRLGSRIHPAGPDIWAQVAYARDREWACTADDVLPRRTTVTVRGLDSQAVRDEVARMLHPAAALGGAGSAVAAPRL